MQKTNLIARNEYDGKNVDRLSLAEFLPYRLSILAESVSWAFARHYEQRFGITVPEWRVMAVLGERSRQTTQEVIARTRMDRVKVSRAAIRLEDKGLIARAPRPDDQRAYNLRLSRRGLVVYRQIVPLAHALQAELLRNLGADEARGFDAVLGKLQACADRLAPDQKSKAVPAPSP